MPGYQIKLWNEDNFDVNCCQYTADAYKEKKYAFVSDYVRFYVIYQQGGIYLDTDVELIKPLDKILKDGPFMGRESMADKDVFDVAPGLGIGAEADMSFYKEMIDLYNGISFYNNDGSLNLKTVVSYTTEKFKEHGLYDVDSIIEVCGIKIYPKDYFCPIDYKTRKRHFTTNTVSIHHYVGSWIDKPLLISFRNWLLRILGETTYNRLRYAKLLIMPKPWKWG